MKIPCSPRHPQHGDLIDTSWRFGPRRSNSFACHSLVLKMKYYALAALAAVPGLAKPVEVARTAPVDPVPCATEYVWQNGDTCARIAEKSGLTLSDFVSQQNPALYLSLEKCDPKLHKGDVVCLARGLTSSTSYSASSTASKLHSPQLTLSVCKLHDRPQSHRQRLQALHLLARQLPPAQSQLIL